ncbi:GIY-YIG nuclease family protein [Microbaculum marinisediminis]|uniref:GIY-YIG nuclease family protein n=1 Tax=Microbaculum marinisediminis TaxID=2931392 RepID=A0AAW5QV08_9HYPH|nr:GIY-YIG nuclease family protein [Microbaculum sp. A6E488]MCT8971334.1 GIY-YIG nuclease family protein [Microbaculum sp. A6E488]
MLTNKPRGVLYVGVTNDILPRTVEHRNSLVPGFTKRYQLKRLVLAEPHPTIAHAIQREKNLKRWSRHWKVALIESVNPDWPDLWEEIQT